MRAIFDVPAGQTDVKSVIFIYGLSPKIRATIFGHVLGDSSENPE
jgi:hypothetical protein